MVDVYSYEETRARAKGNKFRQFPTLAKGRARFLPYARPVVDGPSVPSDANFFAIGACFARGLEKELNSAGRQVLSSPTGLGLPGSMTEQFQRYNIFNLDVALNELTWALSGKTNGAQQALLPLGETLADTQLSWTFAHEPEIAHDFRRIYNGSYSAILDADVVLLATGGIEQWYDAQEGIYINTMPGPVADNLFPGRFQLHRISVQDAKATLQKLIALIAQHSRRDPIFYIAVSPVSQPMIFGPDDILVDQFYAKTVQRQAVEEVVTEDPRCHYLPALEAAMWSDFSYNYLENSMNHTNPNFAARIVSDMLEASGADDLTFKEHRAKSHGQALLAGGGASAAIALCEEAFADGSLYDAELDALYIRALGAAHRRKDALTHAMHRIEAGKNLLEMVLGAASVGNGVIQEDQRDQLVKAAETVGIAAERILVLRTEGNASDSARVRLNTLAQVLGAKDYETALRLANALLDDKDDLQVRDQARLYQALIRSLVALEQDTKAVAASLSIAPGPIVDVPAGFATVEGILRRHGKIPDLEAVLQMWRGRFPDEKLAGLQRILTRRLGARA